VNPPRRSFPFGLLAHWLRSCLPAWGLMAFVIFLVQTVLAAVLHEREDIVSFLSLLDRMPRIFKAFIGGDELMPTNVLGIVAIGYQHPLILTMLMFNAIGTPTALLTAQAERGTMELLLARPIARGRVFGLVAAIALAGQVGLVGIVFLGTAVWTRVFDYGEPVALGGFVHVAVNLAAMACAATGMSLLAAASLAEPRRVVGVTVGYFVGSYLLDFASVWLPSLAWLQPLDLYYYCRPNAVLKAGAIPWAQVGALAGVGAACVIAGWWRWKRRDMSAA